MSQNSSRSDSNIFNLSSNNSQHLQDSIYQFQQFKNKVRNLLQTNTDNLDELYFVIQQKTRNNFFGQQFKDYDQMLLELKQIKSNNRSIAKFVSLLGQKINKGSQANSSKNIKAQNIQAKQKAQKSQEEQQIQTNPTEWSRQYYNYKYRPFSQAFQHKNKEIKQRQDTMTTISINPTNSYQEYQQRNSLYEQKIRNMLNEVSLIKGHLDSSSQQMISPKKIRTYSAKPSTSQNINNQNKKIIQDRTNYVDKSNSASQKQSIEHNPIQEDVDVQPVVVNNTLENSLNQNQKDLGQDYKNHAKHQYQRSKQSDQAQDYLKKVNSRNATLMNYAKNVSKKLQQLKAQTLEIQQQKKRNDDYRNNNQDNLTTFKALQQEEFQKNSNDFQKSMNQEEESSQQSAFNDNFGKGLLKRKDQFVKKKSILDDMKNVESKVLISESLIESHKKAKIIRNNSFQNNIKQETQQQEQIKSKISSQDSAKKVVISYLTMQDKPNNLNQQSYNGFRSIPHQNFQRVSNNSSLSGISQNLNPNNLNSQFFYQNQQQGVPITNNTSIMNLHHQKSDQISKMSSQNIPSFHNRSSSQIINSSSHSPQVIPNQISNISHLRSSQKLNPTSIRGSFDKGINKQIQTGTKPYQSRVSEINDSFFNPLKYLGMQSNNTRNSQLQIQKQLSSGRQNSFLQLNHPFTVNQTAIRQRKTSQNISNLRHNSSSINLNTPTNHFYNHMQNKSNFILPNDNSLPNHSASLSNVIYSRPSYNGSLIGFPPRSSFVIAKGPLVGQRGIQLGNAKRQSEISFGAMSSVQPFKGINQSVRSSSRLSQDSQQSRKSKSKGLQIYSAQK